MNKCREAFEKWFKTTKAYQMLKEMNYFNMDLFHFVDARNEYRHTSVQIAFMTYQSRQAEIDLINATHDGQMIGHDVFVKQIKERHEKQVQGLAKAISKFEKEMDEKDKRIGDQKDFIEMALNSLNHLKENAVTHRDYGHECNWVRSFNDLIKLADDAEDALKQALRGDDDN